MKKENLKMYLAACLALLWAILPSRVEAQTKEQYEVGSTVCVMTDMEKNIWTEGKYLGAEWMDWAGSKMHKIQVGQMIYSIGDFGISPCCVGCDDTPNGEISTTTTTDDGGGSSTTTTTTTGSDGSVTTTTTTSSSGGGSESQGKFSMGDRVCVSHSDGSKRSAMVVSNYSSHWSGEGFDAGYKITYTDNAGRESRNVPESVLEEGDCPYAGAGLPTPEEISAASVNMETLEQQIIAEVNRLRANPKAYAEELSALSFKTYYRQVSKQEYRAIYAGNDRLWYCRQGDEACESQFMTKLNEAIAELSSISGSLGQVTENEKLNEAAQYLSADTEEINGPAHKDSQGRGLFCRCRTAGYNFRAGECLNASHTTAKGFIISFLTSTGHRRILIDPSYEEIGVDTHFHGGEMDGFIRDVIIMGDPDGNSSEAACEKGW